MKKDKYLTLFREVAGDSVRNRVLEYAIEGREINFAPSDITKEYNHSRANTYLSIKNLVKEKILIKSRKIGNTQTYILNKNNIRAKMAIAAFDAILIKRLKGEKQ